MPRMSTLKHFLDTLYDEAGYSKNTDEKSGIISRGKPFVQRISFCVNATKDTIEEAIEKKSDLIIAHNLDCLDTEKMNLLKDTNTWLYVVGLPMDTLDIYGTDWLLAKTLGLNQITPLDQKKKLGYYGISRIGEFSMLIKRLNWLTHAKSEIYQNNKNNVTRVAICAGTPPKKETMDLARDNSCTTFICNSENHKLIPYAKDLGMNLIIANYTATERLSLEALKVIIDAKYTTETLILKEPDY